MRRARGVLERDGLPRIRDGGPSRQPYLATVVDLDDLHPNRLACLEDVVRSVGAVVTHLMKGNQPLDAADVDERAERDDAPDHAVHVLTDLQAREGIGPRLTCLFLDDRPPRQDDIASAFRVLRDEERQTL